MAPQTTRCCEVSSCRVGVYFWTLGTRERGREIDGHATLLRSIWLYFLLFPLSGIAPQRHNKFSNIILFVVNFFLQKQSINIHIATQLNMDLILFRKPPPVPPPPLLPFSSADFSLFSSSAFVLSLVESADPPASLDSSLDLLAPALQQR